jgi:CDP-diacylglycerol--glycerol-3-phosphate 3-phosphatidyltransferase
MLRRVLAEDGGIKLANLVTLTRALLIAPIVGLLLAEHSEWALALYIVAALTDACDGWLARRTGRASAFGAQLDALVDNLFSLAVLLFLLLAFPGIGARETIALLVLFGGPLLYLLISWAFKRRLLMYHFWSAKLGAILLFSLWPLLALTHWEGWLLVTAALVGGSRLEQLVYMSRGGLDLDAPHGFAPIAKLP